MNTKTIKPCSSSSSTQKRALSLLIKRLEKKTLTISTRAMIGPYSNTEARTHQFSVSTKEDWTEKYYPKLKSRCERRERKRRRERERQKWEANCIDCFMSWINLRWVVVTRKWFLHFPKGWLFFSLTMSQIACLQIYRYRECMYRYII